MLPRPLLAIGLAATALVLGAAPARAVTLAVDHDSSTIAEYGPGSNNDGIVAPGDTFTLAERLISAELSPITSASGLLTSQTAGVTVQQGASAYPDLTFGVPAGNSTPFRAQIDTSIDCGQDINLNVALNAAGGSASIPFTVSTGVTSPSAPYDSADVPLPLADFATVNSTFQVTGYGRVRDFRVRIPRITHPYVGDLRIEIIAPDGTKVLLVDQQGGAAANFVDTVFDQTAPTSITDGSAPFTGSFRPQGDLHALRGRQIHGTWTLRIKDMVEPDVGTLDAWGADISTAVCSGAPIPSFTADPTPAVPGAPVTFDPAGSFDPNGSIVEYRWDFDNDGTFDATTTTPDPVTHTYATEGSVVARLQVEDNNGETGEATRTLPVTQAPVPAFTASSTSPFTTQSVGFDASASSDPDPGGSIVKYEWDLDGNGSFETVTTSPVVNRTYATPGPVVVKLRVTDNIGATAATAQTITVQNTPPVAAFAGPNPAPRNQQVTYDAAGSSDVDGPVTAYEWDLDGDGSFETPTGSASSVQTTYTANGPVDVRLRVTDADGGQDVTTMALVVTDAPAASFTATPNPVSLGLPVAFAATASDADGSIAKYEWDLDGNGTFETDTGTTPGTSHAYSAGGTYQVRLRVTDDLGARTVVTVPVTALNFPPVVSLTASPVSPVTGASVTFDASASYDPDGAIARFEWDLDGNGSFEADTGASPRASHAYPNHGPVTIRVRVTDEDGGAAIAPLTITVADPPATDGTGAGAGTSGGSGSNGGTGGTGGAGSSGSDPLAASLGGRPIQKLAGVRRRGIALACQADRAVSCVVTLDIARADARRLGLAARSSRVRIGSARIVLTAKGTRTVTIKLSARARRALRRARTVRVMARGTATDAAGHRASLVRVLLLRR